MNETSSVCYLKIKPLNSPFPFAFSLLASTAIFLSGCSTPIAPSSSLQNSQNNQKSLENYLKNNANNAINPTNPTNSTNPINPVTPSNLLLNIPTQNSNINAAGLEWSPFSNNNLNNNITENLGAGHYPNLTSNHVNINPRSIPFNSLDAAQNANSLYTQNDLEQALIEDSLEGFWPAWLNNCKKLVSKQTSWQNACYQAQMIAPSDINSQKQYIRQYFQPQKLALRYAEQSKITGYYEPLLKGSRQPNQLYRYPIYQKPNQNGGVTGYASYASSSAQNYQQLTREQLLQSSMLRGSELIYLSNPVDAALVEIQGSALIELDQSNDYGNSYAYANTYNSNPSPWVRVAFDGANQYNFKSFIQYLLNKKYITRAEMAIPNLRNWALTNPFLIQEAINSNPRFIFFKNIEYNQGGPIGAYGLPLTPQRSIAVDTTYIKLGSPVVIKFNHPILGQIHRFVIAQDVGNAIKGSVRADFFWGLGEEALKLANATNAEGELAVLQPKM